MTDHTKKGPREYRHLDIQGAVVVKPEKHLSLDAGWTIEPADFTELAHFLGYKFDPRGIHMFHSPKGIIRGGHAEGRAKYITIASGLVYQTLVDTRPGEDQGKAIGFYLGDGDLAWGNSVLIPEGVVSSLVPMDDNCIFVAVADRPFNRFDSLAVLDLFDPALELSWPEGTRMQIVEESSQIVGIKELIKNV